MTEIVVDGVLWLKSKKDVLSPVANLIVLITFLICFYYMDFVATSESPSS